jgi:hypothetical protein
MKSVLFTFSIFLIFSFAKPKEIVYGQSADLLEQINSFDNENISQIIKDMGDVINTQAPKVLLADELCQNLRALKKECTVGYVSSSRLINKLNYYNKLEYIDEVTDIGVLFKKLYKHFDEMQYFAKKMKVNPDRYKTRTLAFFNKKMELVAGVQKELQNKTKKLTQINAWEEKHAPANMSDY